MNAAPTKVVVRPVPGLHTGWIAVWAEGDQTWSLQGKDRRAVESAVRVKLGSVEFYELGSPEWEQAFGSMGGG